MKNNNKNECKQDCACKSEEVLKSAKDNSKSDVKLDLEDKSKAKNTLDPTHFGDWQVNCRAIDF